MSVKGKEKKIKLLERCITKLIWNVTIKEVLGQKIYQKSLKVNNVDFIEMVKMK
jgi:hypothetical protein